MTYQRRKGQKVRVFSLRDTVDGRGNPTIAVDYTRWQDIRAAFIYDRSSRAEVTGQHVVDVYKMICSPKAKGADMWSVVEWDGHYWDVIAPPAKRRGIGPTRHLSLEIRRRPETPEVQDG